MRGDFNITNPVALVQLYRQSDRHLSAKLVSMLMESAASLFLKNL
jgi:hypothetical protein